MNKIHNIYLLSLITGASLLAGVSLLTGCASADDAPTSPADTKPAPEAYIRIASGAASTRTDFPQPQKNGECNADKITIWKYRNHGGVYPSSKDLTFSQDGQITEEEKKGMITLDVIHYTEVNDTTITWGQSDKWARTNVYLDFGSMWTSFAFPALAYTNGDDNYFEVSYEGKYEDVSLSLKSSNGIKTPELYFGRLRPRHFDNNKDILYGDRFDTDGTIGNLHERNPFYQSDSYPVEGTLYRIVSQININMTDVNTKAVNKMEMYVSNVPNKIGLYAAHRSDVGKAGTDQGYYYPIVAAKEADHFTDASGWIKVDETTRFPKSNATMSAFFLPSEIGRRLRIRVYFNEGYMVDSKGKPVQYKDYDVKAPKSEELPQNVSNVYYSTTPLPVYDLPDNLFFSYSNIRINLNGAFDNFFPVKKDVEMNLEICPSYDVEHKYVIN